MKRIFLGLTVLIFFTLSVSAGQNPRIVSNPVSDSPVEVVIRPSADCVSIPVLVVIPRG